MKTEEVLKMGPAELNLLISKYVGWRSIEYTGDGTAIGTSPEGHFMQRLPNWAGDLNEINKLEFEIFGPARSRYAECLLNVVFQKTMLPTQIRENLFNIVCASPLQRAQALYLWLRNFSS